MSGTRETGTRSISPAGGASKENLSNQSLTNYNQSLARLSHQMQVITQHNAKRRAPKEISDAVAVHVIKLEDLPQPLSKREFREICLREGMPLHNFGGELSCNTPQNDFSLSKDLHQRRVLQRWSNTMSNLFGAYLAVFEMFKLWHSGIIQQRHVGPSNVEEHTASNRLRKPYMMPSQKSKLSSKEQVHLKRQQGLVSLLIKYGIGLGLEPEKSTSPDLKQRQKTSRHNKRSTTADEAFSPLGKSLSPSHNYAYGPAVDNRMLHEQFATNQKGTQRHANQLFSSQESSINIHHGIHPRGRISIGVSEEDESIHRRSSIHHRSDVESQEFIEKNQEHLIYTDAQSKDEERTEKERLRVLTSGPGSTNISFERSKTLRIQPSNMRSKQKPRIRDFESSEYKIPLNEQELRDNKEFYSPVHLRLRNELIDLRAKVKELQLSLKNSQNRSKNIITKYQQEEVARSVHSELLSMPYPEQAKQIKNQIESRFVNVADGLEPYIVDILNNKMAQIKEYFIAQIQLVTHHTESLRQNVAMMEAINKEGIKFSDMDTEKLIEKIADIEALKRDQNATLRTLDPSSRSSAFMNRPMMIWQWLQQKFGNDYFVEVIEEEYGISPGSNEFFAAQIEQHFNTQLANFKDEQQRLEQEYKEMFDKLSLENQGLTEANTRLMRQDQIAHDKLRKEMRAAQKVLVKSQEEAQMKAWKSKYNDAKQMIIKLNQNRDTQYRSQKSMQLNYTWKRWQMFNIIQHVVKTMDESRRTGIDCRMLKLCERFIREECLILRYSHDNDVPKELVKDQMHTDKILKMKHKREEITDSFGIAFNRASSFEMQIEGYRQQIEKLSKSNRDLLLELPALKAQNELFEDALKLKEKEIVALLEENKNIENRWKNQTKEPKKFTAKTILNALQLKSLNEMSGYLTKVANARKRLSNNLTNRGTQTEIANITIKVDYERKPQNTTGVEQEVDATVTMMHRDCQTEPGGIDVAVGKDRDFTLKSKKVGTADDEQKEKESKEQQKKKSADIHNSVHKRTVTKAKPMMQKSQSTVLGSKEFQFNRNNKAGQQMSRSKIGQESLEDQFKRNGSQNNDDQSNNTKIHRKTMHVKRSQPQLQPNASVSDRSQKRPHEKNQNKEDSNTIVSSEAVHFKSSSQLNQGKRAEKSSSVTMLRDKKRSDNNRTQNKDSENQPSQNSVYYNKQRESTENSKSPVDQEAQHGTVKLTSEENQYSQKIGQEEGQHSRITSAHYNSTKGPVESMYNRQTISKLKSKRDLLQNQHLLSQQKPETSHQKLRGRKPSILISKKSKMFSEDPRGSGKPTYNMNSKQFLHSNMTNSINEKHSEYMRDRAISQNIILGFEGKSSKGGTIPKVRESDKTPEIHDIVHAEADELVGFDQSSHQNPTLLMQSQQESRNEYNTDENQDNEFEIDEIEGQTGAQTDQLQFDVNYLNTNLRAASQEEDLQAQFRRHTNSLPIDGDLQGSRSITALDEQQIHERNLAAGEHFIAQRRPTTVRDTSNDQSNPSMRQRDQSQHVSSSRKASRFGNSRRSHSKNTNNLSQSRREALSGQRPQERNGKRSPLDAIIISQQKQMADQIQNNLLGQDSNVEKNLVVQRHSHLAKPASLLFGGNQTKASVGLNGLQCRGKQIYKDKKRLTLVREHAGEYPTSGSTAKQSLIGLTKYAMGRVYVEPVRDSLLKAKKSSGRHSRGNSSSPSLHRMIQGAKSFATSQDSCQYSNNRSDEAHQRQSKMQQHLNIVNQKVIDQAEDKTRTKIQQLLLDGLISEEQFICLQLLEKGYIPSSPDGDFQFAPKGPSSISISRSQPVLNQETDQKRSNSRSKHQRDQAQQFFIHPNKTQTDGFKKKSHSRSPQSGNSMRRRSPKMETTYRIYPNRLPILEKILDRVYAKNKSTGIHGYSSQDTSDDQQYKHDKDWVESLHRTTRTRLTSTIQNKLLKKGAISPKLKLQTHRRLRSKRNSNKVQSHSQSNQLFNLQGINAKDHSGFASTNKLVETFMSGHKNRQFFKHQHLPTIHSQPKLDSQGFIKSAEQQFSDSAATTNLWISSIPLETVNQSHTNSSKQFQVKQRQQKYHKIAKRGQQSKILQALVMDQGPRTTQPTAMTMRQTNNVVDSLTKSNSNIVNNQAELANTSISNFSATQPAHKLIVASSGHNSVKAAQGRFSGQSVNQSTGNLQQRKALLTAEKSIAGPDHPYLAQTVQGTHIQMMSQSVQPKS